LIRLSDPPVQVEVATWWTKAASLIGGSKSTGHTRSGGVGYAVLMADNDGSELLIYVLRASEAGPLGCLSSARGVPESVNWPSLACQDDRVTQSARHYTAAAGF
jgi:hypothetical protein